MGLDGTILAGRYSLLTRIGAGARSEVYKAVDSERGGETVAVKILVEPTLPLARRFLHEGAFLKRLRHPNIVAVHESGVALGTAYLVMDYVLGSDAADHARAVRECRPGIAGLRLAIRPFVGLARAIGDLHLQGILHRDIKPSNVKVTSKGRAVLLDLGIARLGPDDRTICDQGEVCGTPAYMAPEQLSGRRELEGPRTDIYQLGATLYHALVGEPPFEGAWPELIKAIRAGCPERVSSRDGELDGCLDSIVLGCLEKDPSDRFQSTFEVARRLEAWLDLDGPNRIAICSSAPLGSCA